MSKFFLDQSRSDAKFIVRRGVQCTVLTFSREVRDRSSRKPEARKETISLLSKVYFLARADVIGEHANSLVRKRMRNGA